MDFEKTVAVVTGANRGLGREFARQLAERGAKVYAAVRRPESVEDPGVIPIKFDLTDEASIDNVAKIAADATLLVNNAGVSTQANLLDGDFDKIRLEMETHYFGTLAATRAFAPVIERNGGGAILNVHSILSWLHAPQLGAYSAAKAAGWAMSNALRQELAPRGIQVTALYVAYMDTDMAAMVAPADKIDPAGVASASLDGVAAGVAEVIGDERTRSVRERLGAAI
ncbi:SDR family oxidoreductase [Kibdelosporangium phytohabitans]|uniref:Short-chain dehydrogenase n=1 Tax=Kibdelosporangium phytohabitans TaxID=860235 RepID=A0A0N9HQJ3_9PSEU|nr:SDR family oxidoreductase [Kibdelosporangium phytohabitans]ALG07016.1 short-chain dehydrogenase [Kibdelosporangium phytohabitans]MBE1468307.1 NAD(P)-dependent dehydrogenase (short-subunit alcohol dehydrogenase family) [Kibdelosporangium phytohabitans]